MRGWWAPLDGQLCTMGSMTLPPPPKNKGGWYPDPEGSGKLRWWGGERWSERMMDRPAAAVSSGDQPSRLGLPSVDPMGEILAEVKGATGTLVLGTHALKIKRGALGKVVGHRGEKVIPYRKG